MTEQTLPDTLYVGLRSTVITEVGGYAHLAKGKYIVHPDGRGAWDADGFGTLREVRANIEEWKSVAPNIRVVWL